MVEHHHSHARIAQLFNNFFGAIALIPEHKVGVGRENRIRVQIVAVLSDERQLR